ncbi:hypothetical protein [Roseicitreum antarcticum]|uniref:Uncharacterized protein n=1 Tax=Roseicitreum antarcticum TaxID=564137 RepID=A0A1H3E6M9_9RHOB|nr:hypothetical protein [Roseicitreum antarcticum]SDX73594.1 hypothetical protein SAMN04488238_1186 [Roseicitreum antarcticum]
MIVISAIVLGFGPMAASMYLTERWGWGYAARGLFTGAMTLIGLFMWLVIFARP